MPNKIVEIAFDKMKSEFIGRILMGMILSCVQLANAYERAEAKEETEIADDIGTLVTKLIADRYKIKNEKDFNELIELIKDHITNKKFLLN